MNSDFECNYLYQNDLLVQIFGTHSTCDSPGLKIYRNNLAMTALRSLSISYPVIHKMIGEQALYVLVKRLIEIELPSTGDWADWGKGLSHVLEQSELHDEHPYLTDIAKLEWAFLLASRSGFADLDIDSLALLKDDNVEAVKVLLNSSLMLIASDFPLYSLWRLHRSATQNRLPTRDELTHALNSGESGYYLVCQSINGPKVVTITRDYFDWITAVQSGSNIGQLLDAFPDFNFSTWLSDSIMNGWLSSLSK